MGKGHSSGGGGGKGGHAPQQTQAQINHARECNPNSAAYWQTRQMDVPSTNRVDAAQQQGY